MKKHAYKILAVSATAFLLSSPLMADEGADLYTAKLCHTCHGADAKSPTLPAYPKLAGQNEEYTLQQLKDFKSGARSNGQSATMKAMLATVSEEEMAKLAKYIAGLDSK